MTAVDDWQKNLKISEKILKEGEILEWLLSLKIIKLMWFLKVKSKIIRLFNWQYKACQPFFHKKKDAILFGINELKGLSNMWQTGSYKFAGNN